MLTINISKSTGIQLCILNIMAALFSSWSGTIFCF